MQNIELLVVHIVTTGLSSVRVHTAPHIMMQMFRCGHNAVPVLYQHSTNTVPTLSTVHVISKHKIWISQSHRTDDYFSTICMPCQLVNNYWRYEEPQSVHLTGPNSPQECTDYFRLKMETLWYAETSVNIYQSARRNI